MAIRFSYSLLIALFVLTLKRQNSKYKLTNGLFNVKIFITQILDILK